MNRQIIQITAAAGGKEETVVALCNDGTLWRGHIKFLSPEGGAHIKWRRIVTDDVEKARPRPRPREQFASSVDPPSPIDRVDDQDFHRMGALLETYRGAFNAAKALIDAINSGARLDESTQAISDYSRHLRSIENIGRYGLAAHQMQMYQGFLKAVARGEFPIKVPETPAQIKQLLSEIEAWKKAADMAAEARNVYREAFEAFEAFEAGMSVMADIPIDTGSAWYAGYNKAKQKVHEHEMACHKAFVMGSVQAMTPDNAKEDR